MKLFITLLFCIHVLNASEKSYLIKAQLLESILMKVSINEDIRVWSDNKKLLDKLKDLSKLSTVNSCQEANIVILHDKNALMQNCKDKHIFALNYSLLTEVPQCFGALFYKKGRPNVVIIKPRVESQSIHISKDLREYVEEQIW